MGDVNVSLNLEDHSEGMSNFTQDMIDFQECVNEIKMEDINSSSLHFTWIKILLNPNSSFLKKIVRVMGNNAFLTKFSTANAIFLPYRISGHIPTILKIPQAMKKKNKSFRLANYVIDKMEFKDLFKEKQVLEVQGHHMHRLVKRLKSLKPYLNKLNWKNGNLFEKVVVLKTKLHDVERRIDMDPANKDLRNEEIKKALFDIDDDKAPGPDGFTSKFFKKAWEIIKEELCDQFIDEETKNNISNIFPFKEGKLPVRYLGVPLVTKKIGVADCKQLVDKVRHKLSDWKNKSLSYARRAQLIASVFGSMQVYWGYVFLLLKSVINEIEKMFKKFLWNSEESCKGKSKVAWMDLCKPKDQGGLGFKSLELWNKTLLVKHLWNVASRKESLWVKWINVVKLKKRSVWDITDDSKDSWGWKCLLKLRAWVGEHMRYRIGDGKSNSVWHDNWNNETSLSNVISKKEIFYAGFSDHDKISDVMDGKAKKKLYTQDMLSKWYPSKVFECSLCKKEPDSHDHLFFNCEYAQRCGRRNLRLFNNGMREAHDLVDIMTEELKVKMVSITVKNSDSVIQAEMFRMNDLKGVANLCPAPLRGVWILIAISDGLVS
ncbi:RNA-directed DNA polymerase, eukaryota, reverse transcriptase zinc-binding domain protein [Tanacetum coccineum]|uniref:RNA-directed DNA polymerase, eukaryota, reverse transcriptase zinc-binding domain protein n=1 Tax=Tanacetum coccineum TaxID=301880 RepID=A0ABQ5GDH4_9ASTR